jgi:hypothetical protein
LQEQKEEVYDSVRDLYDRKDEAREKFLDIDNYVRQKEKESPDKLHLSLNGQNIFNWFKQQFSKLNQTIRRPVIQPKKGGGIKM